MKRIALLFLLATLLSSSISYLPASGAEFTEAQKQSVWISQSEDAVRNHLKDGASAKFRNVEFFHSQYGPIVCGEVNAKNSFGGYQGYDHFLTNGENITALEEEVSDFATIWGQACHTK